MRKLDKSTLALTFKFDCDRFLRFRLATTEEQHHLGLALDRYKRPGIQLITAAGRRWEADKYQDLLDVAPSGRVAHRLSTQDDPLVGRQLFGPVTNLFDLLRHPVPPLAMIEAEFEVPSAMTPGLQQAYERYGLDPVKARPDLLWVRPARTGAPLIGAPAPGLAYELHVIDVKMAAEPSLRHFTEVTYYALGLAAALRQHGLAERYAVSAEGFIWPGNHDAQAFRTLHRAREAAGDADPVTAALLATLVPVPYEVYQVHVKHFFADRLLRVLGQDPLEASWHVGPKCQLCDYVPYCREHAERGDHLSRLPWLNHGQATLLRQHGIATTQALAHAIEHQTPAWHSTIASSHHLRAEAPALLARTRALRQGQPEVIPGRRSALMPAWSDQSLFLTVHFDPGSGITFALGAARVYFPPTRQPGDPPITAGQVFLVDRVQAMNPETERARLVEFVTLVTGWLEEIATTNAHLPAAQRVSSHVFVWDMLEMRQLRRMFERHMQHPDVVEVIELLLRLFPPDTVLPDPDLFKSQPGTVVKEVLRVLLGLPLPHDYTLLETANTFYPRVDATGKVYPFRLPFGFTTAMSDQIPFERAYELWHDTIFLRHYDPHVPDNPARWRRYTRDEIYEGLKHATRVHLLALQHIVRRLRDQCRAQLILQKSAFSAAPPRQARIPAHARSLVAFEKLNVVCQELENRQRRALPVVEREALFFSIRGICLAVGQPYEDALAALRLTHPRYATTDLLACTFAPTSRDARIGAGDFLVALSNEDADRDLDLPWRRHLGWSFPDAQHHLHARGLTAPWMVNAPLGRVLQVEVVCLEVMQQPPFLVVSPAHSRLFQYARDAGLLCVDRPMILDPLFQDFTSTRIEQVLQTVGGDPPPRRRRQT